MTRVRQLRANEFVRPIRISDIGKPGVLPYEEAIAAIAMAMEELAIAESFAIIHGKERAARMYAERGGHVRFDADGEPVLMWRRSMMDIPSPFAKAAAS